MEGFFVVYMLWYGSDFSITYLMLVIIAEQGIGVQLHNNRINQVNCRSNSLPYLTTIKSLGAVKKQPDSMGNGKISALMHSEAS